MSAGLPGLGLGGLFFVLSALACAAGRARREPSVGRARWSAGAGSGRQLAIALTMIAAVELTLRVALWALAGFSGSGMSGRGFVAMPLEPLLITTGLLAIVLGSAKLAQLCFAVGRKRRIRAARRSRERLPASGPSSSPTDPGPTTASAPATRSARRRRGPTRSPARRSAPAPACAARDS